MAHRRQVENGAVEQTVGISLSDDYPLIENPGQYVRKLHQRVCTDCLGSSLIQFLDPVDIALALDAQDAKLVRGTIKQPLENVCAVRSRCLALLHIPQDKCWY